MATTTDIPTFVAVSNIDLKDLIDAADSNNTKKQIKYGINRLDAYAKFVGTTSISAVEALSMCVLLMNFFVVSTPAQRYGNSMENWHEKVNARNPLRVAKTFWPVYSWQQTENLWSLELLMFKNIDFIMFCHNICGIFIILKSLNLFTIEIKYNLFRTLICVILNNVKSIFKIHQMTRIYMSVI